MVSGERLVSSVAPLIGIILDYQEAPTFSTYPWYALRSNYFKALSSCGAIPVGLSYDSDPQQLVGRLDGLLVAGGSFDIPARFYTTEPDHPRNRPNEKRTQFEITLLKTALERQVPVLGICAGAQLLNVACGGTLIQYLPDVIPEGAVHQQVDRRHEGVHHIQLVSGSLLHQWSPTPELMVNSNHQQAIDQVGQGLRICARSPDGVIEGVEAIQSFALGVQWHPEFLVSPLDHIIFQSFVKECHERRP
jgi:putative glutamine amidotransferase